MFLTEAIKIDNIQLSIRSFLKQYPKEPVLNIAKWVISKQTSVQNFDKNRNPIFDSDINENNFVDKVMEASYLANNIKARQIVIAIKAELFGNDGNRKFGRTNSVITESCFNY